MPTGAPPSAALEAASPSARPSGTAPRDNHPGSTITRQSSVAARLLIVALLTLICLRDAKGVVAERIREATAPYAFDLLDWEIRHVAEKLQPVVAALRGEATAADAADVATVRQYSELPAAARVGRRDETEAAIERLVAGALRDEGMVLPSPLAAGVEIVFPPVSFTFSEPPKVLIVSPRDRITVSKHVLLRPGLDPSTATLIEDDVSAGGVSSLVTSIGGLATYPAMVLTGRTPESTLAAVAHEWIHAYFFFRPLGRGYWASQDVRTINETAAELAGVELGRRLARQYGLPTDPPPSAASGRQAEFNRLMRETRLEVDRLLAVGRVAEAEAYMEQRRQTINALGYNLRRLNQAYFAFNGSYAESPAGSSPIAGQVRRLRDRGPTLGAFLRTIADVSTPADLERLAG